MSKHIYISLTPAGTHLWSSSMATARVIIQPYWGITMTRSTVIGSAAVDGNECWPNAFAAINVGSLSRIGANWWKYLDGGWCPGVNQTLNQPLEAGSMVAVIA